MKRSSTLGGLALFLLVGCTGEIGNGEGESSSSGGPGPNPNPAAFEPAAPTLHRLTSSQLKNTWLALFGEPLAMTEQLPADDRLYGFSAIAAASTTISPVDAEEYERATYEILDQVWADDARRTALLGCDAAGMNEACLRAYLEGFVPRAWRRPVAAEEVDALVALANQIGADLSDPVAAAKFTTAAVLQSPHFLFRVEVGEPDADRPTLLRFTSFEMASRLSYLLTDSPPDDTLFARAEAGDLLDPDAIDEEAGRLLADPRSKPALTRFFRDYMNIVGLDSVDKSAEAFPQFSATMGASMRTEMELVFQDAAFSDADFREVFTTKDTYLNQELANLYGIEWPGGDEFLPVTLPASAPRAGLLTTPGFLALNAHETKTSPTHRGRFVRINLLCQDVPPPPPGVDTSLPETEPGDPVVTLREKLSAHVKNPECNACHVQMDPIGFAFEEYDAIGQYRVVDENGLALDVATEVDGEPIEGAIEMAHFIGELPQAAACVARRFYEHAGAHLATEGEEASVQRVVSAFVDGDHVFRALVVGLVTNDGFRYAAKPSQEDGR
jgi:hypothetical protein